MTSAQQKRPRRQRKADRLLHSDARAEEIRCDYAVAPLDRAAQEMDRKWGIDRLPELVSAETAEKYGSAMAKLNAAIASNDPKEVASRAAVCIRGLNAMDVEAVAMGRKPASGNFWEYEVSGFRFAILEDHREWQAAKDARPDLTFFSMREVGLALKSYCEVVPIEAVKDHFPGSQIKALPEQLPREFFEKGGDEIPW